MTINFGSVKARSFMSYGVATAVVTARVTGGAPLGIDRIPSEAFKRGVIASMMDTEKPALETFTDGKAVFPMAFVAGLPMPYPIFSLFLAHRLAPNRVQGAVAALHGGGNGLTEDQDVQIIHLWKRIDLPSELREEIVKSASTASLISRFVAEMVNRCVNSDETDMTVQFRQLIIRIEEDYGSSLLDPVRV